MVVPNEMEWGGVLYNREIRDDEVNCLVIAIGSVCRPMTIFDPAIKLVLIIAIVMLVGRTTSVRRPALPVCFYI